jgi:hypothetical protein
MQADNGSAEALEMLLTGNAYYKVLRDDAGTVTAVYHVPLGLFELDDAV